MIRSLISLPPNTHTHTQFKHANEQHATFRLKHSRSGSHNLTPSGNCSWYYTYTSIYTYCRLQPSEFCLKIYATIERTYVRHGVTLQKYEAILNTRLDDHVVVVVEVEVPCITWHARTSFAGSKHFSQSRS